MRSLRKETTTSKIYRCGFTHWVALFICTLVMGACGVKEEEVEDDDTDLLYHSTLKLTKIYADSIKMATDSATASGAFSRFNAELDSLNFRVRPDTDLLLTEGENDTIYANLMTVRKIYDRKMKELGEIPRQEVETEE